MTNLLPGELGRRCKFGTSRRLDSLICRCTPRNQGAWRRFSSWNCQIPRPTLDRARWGNMPEQFRERGYLEIGQRPGAISDRAQ